MRNIAFILLIIFLAGCSGVTPIPTTPEFFIKIKVDSIPSNAILYELDPRDGTLGDIIGKTPYTFNYGLACSRDSLTGALYYYAHRVNLWGQGIISWGKYKSANPTQGDPLDLLMNLAIIKEGYYTSNITNKIIATIGKNYNFPPAGDNITVQLRKIVKEAPKPEPARQQQQQQQQQTVIIPQNNSSSSSSQEKGIVMITSTFQDAEVYVDHSFLGNVPANLKLDKGIHIIEVKKSGYKTYRREIRVFGSSEINLRAVLEKE